MTLLMILRIETDIDGMEARKKLNYILISMKR